MAPSVTILVNGTTADADDLNDIHTALIAYLTNIDPTYLKNVQLLNNIRHGFLGSGTSNYHDIANIYGSLRNAGFSYHATVPATCTVTIPANTAVTGLYVCMGALLTIATGTDVHLPLNLAGGATPAAADLSATGAGYDPRFELEATYTGSISMYQEKWMNINATTVPTLGGGFAAAYETILKIGTAYTGSNGSAAKYSLLVIPY
jgi:hypothetical protein